MDVADGETNDHSAKWKSREQEVTVGSAKWVAEGGEDEKEGGKSCFTEGGRNVSVVYIAQSQH